MAKKTIVYDDRFLKVLSATDQGVVTAYVSCFGNVDLQGDRVVKGAFATSLKKWRASGKQIPVIWSHSWADPFDHLGYVTDAMEDDTGLLVAMKFDLDMPRAAQVFRLIKARRVDSYSFAYDIVRERRAEDGANDLLELDIIECGPALKGANPATSTVSVKSDAPTIDPDHDPAHWLKTIDALDRQPALMKTAKSEARVNEFLKQIEAEAAAEQAEREKQVQFNAMVAARSAYLTSVSLQDEQAKLAEEHAQYVADMEERDRVQAEQVRKENEFDRARRDRAQDDPNVFAD